MKRKPSYLTVFVILGLLMTLAVSAVSTSANQVPPTTVEDWTRLTFSPYIDKNADWSPSGSHIAWVQFHGGWSRHIWEMEAASGDNKVQLTTGNIEEAPTIRRMAEN
jgi:hypothetical protein